MPKKIVAVNERGRRIGESHPRAKLTDHEVDLVRELAEQGLPYAEIAAKFEVHRQTVKRIVRCERRGQSIAGHKAVKEKVPAPA